jgi:hypothetical protein
VSAKLVIGANGFLGSHVTRQLVANGHEVRAMVRPNADTIGIDDLSLTRFSGDIWDNDTLRDAMHGVDDVYYCVVDTRGWLRDPAPLFRTNVDGTCNVLEVAKTANLRKFVFTSSYVTVGRRRGRVATEDDIIVDRGLTPYVGPACRPRTSSCSTRGSTACPPSRWGCRRHTEAVTGAAPRTARSSRGGVRQAAIRDERHRTGGRRRRRRGAP